MSRQVINVALPGYNALTDTDPNHFSLYVDEATDHVLIKEKTRASQSVNGTNVTVAHNLSYVPLVFCFVEVSSGVWRKLYSYPIDGTGYWFTVNDTNIVLNNNTGVAKTFAYYIFYDNIT
jgi:hypothetical protein